MVSGVSVVDCKWGKILRRMVVVCLIFGRMFGLYLLFFVYLSLICILLFRILIVGIYIRYKWYANDIVFNISNTKYLLIWFA